MLTLPLYLNKDPDTLPLDKNLQKKRGVWVRAVLGLGQRLDLLSK